MMFPVAANGAATLPAGATNTRQRAVSCCCSAFNFGVFTVSTDRQMIVLILRSGVFCASDIITGQRGSCLKLVLQILIN